MEKKQTKTKMNFFMTMVLNLQFNFTHSTILSNVMFNITICYGVFFSRYFIIFLYVFRPRKRSTVFTGNQSRDGDKWYKNYYGGRAKKKNIFPENYTTLLIHRMKFYSALRIKWIYGYEYDTQIRKDKSKEILIS